MQYFPVCISLCEKRCLVVGAGEVGRRKVRNLLDFGAEYILLLDNQETCFAQKEFAQNNNIRIEQRSFTEEDLLESFLVFASTNDPETNKKIGKLCASWNILCNIADQPETGNFIQPALLKRGDLSITISSNAKSPALVRKIKNSLKSSFGAEYGTWIELLGRLRGPVLGLDKDSNYNKNIFSSLTDEAILDAIREKDKNRLLALLQDRLPLSLHPNLKEVVNELF